VAVLEVAEVSVVGNAAQLGGGADFGPASDRLGLRCFAWAEAAHLETLDRRVRIKPAVTLAIACSIATSALGAGPIAECKQGQVAFDNGLTLSVPRGYCLSFGQHADFVAGRVLRIRGGEVLLNFYAGTGGPPIEALREHGYDTNCAGPVRERSTGFKLTTSGVKGSLFERTRTSTVQHMRCRESVYFTRISAGSESASLLVFTYSSPSGPSSDLADQLIASVHPTHGK